MTETLVRLDPRAAAVTIRPYRPSDHQACRRLWAEFTEEHRALYGDPTHGGSDPGAAFEEYLTRLDLSGLWVADHREDGVVGMIGLLLDGRAGEVEPVVVTARRRGEGTGRALLGYVAEQASRRSLRQLHIAPSARNVDALRCLHAAGYDAVATVTLAIDLTRPGQYGQGEQDGLDLYGLRFRY